MAKTNYRSVDEYITAQPEAVHLILSTVRHCLREAIPEAEETISYQIPCYKLRGKVLLFFAGWKHHYSLYPAQDMADAFKAELVSYEVSKGTIRFLLSQPVPVVLISRLAQFRANQILTIE